MEFKKCRFYRVLNDFMWETKETEEKHFTLSCFVASIAENLKIQAYCFVHQD